MRSVTWIGSVVEISLIVKRDDLYAKRSHFARAFYFLFRDVSMIAEALLSLCPWAMASPLYMDIPLYITKTALRHFKSTVAHVIHLPFRFQQIINTGVLLFAFHSLAPGPVLSPYPSALAKSPNSARCFQALSMAPVSRDASGTACSGQPLRSRALAPFGVRATHAASCRAKRGHVLLHSAVWQVVWTFFFGSSCPVSEAIAGWTEQRHGCRCMDRDN